MLRRLIPVLVLLTLGPAAHGERLVKAPDVAGRAQTAYNKDGTRGPLYFDADFQDRADRWRKAHPLAFAARGEMLQVEQVLVLQGDDATVMTDGSGWGVRSLAAVTKRVIEEKGDKFDFITVVLSFNDINSPMAGAYEQTINQEVQGIGQGVFSRAGSYGSAKGTLKSVLNMKQIIPQGSAGSPSDGDLEVWGQESAHRWLIYLTFRDPRTGKESDALLGRQCAHYSRFVDTQASIEDGFAWRDNGDGSFTSTAYTERYGNLDLYAMGLLALDDVPPFFFIDGIAGYTYPRCGDTYDKTSKPGGTTIKGTRVDVKIDDIVAVNGVRSPSADEVKGYYREAIVLLTRADETAASNMTAAKWIDNARKRWETWNVKASQHRQVICTSLDDDCGDPRSDVVSVDVKPNFAGAVVPSAGTIPVDVLVTNTGGRDTTNVKATLDVKAGDKTWTESHDIGDLAVGASSTQSFSVDLADVPCGTRLDIKASTQSEYHFHRKRLSIYAGVADQYSDDFEADTGWKANPDGDDSAAGGVHWERGTPQLNRVVSNKYTVQPGAAHTGSNAWVTGAAAGDNTWISGGKATLESAEYDASALKEPMLRFWYAFTGARGTASGIEATDDGHLIVQAKTDGGWIEIDRIANVLAGKDWTQRLVKLPAELDLKGPLKFRFVAEDASPMLGLVEAAIDDVAVTTNVPQCLGIDPDAGAQDAGNDGAGGGSPGTSGCGCRVAAPPAFVPFGLLGGALALLVRRSRRRR